MLYGFDRALTLTVFFYYGGYYYNSSIYRNIKTIPKMRCYFIFRIEYFSDFLLLFLHSEIDE